MVRVAHPGHGMGVEFPSRTAEQRQQVENVINFLRSCPGTMPDLDISPKALVADITQFEPAEKPANPDEEMEDPLLELLRRGASLQQEDSSPNCSTSGILKPLHLSSFTADFFAARLRSIDNHSSGPRYCNRM